jgi:WD40 repeat protein
VSLQNGISHPSVVLDALFAASHQFRVEICILKGHTASITALASFPAEDSNNHLFVSGSFDTTVRIWDTRQKTSINTFKAHAGQVNALQVTPDGKWIATGGQDGLVKVSAEPGTAKPTLRRFGI